MVATTADAVTVATTRRDAIVAIFFCSICFLAAVDAVTAVASNTYRFTEGYSLTSRGGIFFMLKFYKKITARPKLGICGNGSLIKIN